MIRALQSRWSLDARALLLVSLPTLFILPASESNGDLDAFWDLGIANLIALTISMAIIQVFSITRWVRRRWYFVIGVGTLSGAAKGSSLWLAVDALGYQQPELGSRIVLSTLSTVLFILILAIIQSSLGESRTSAQQVRQMLTQAKQEFDSLEAQRNWLVQAKVRGIETKLAQDFVQLLASLNNLGKGPAAIKDIARELRAAARGNVRGESASAWKGEGPQLGALALRTLQTRPNALLTLLAFLVSAGINSLRLNGFGAELLVVLGTCVALWLSLSLIRASFGHLTAPIVVLLADAGMQLFTSGSLNLISSAASAIWSLTLILTASALELARVRIEEDRRAATEALSTTQADIEWLSIQLEATNLELAKYLHSILQTRLMSHALLLEQNQTSSQDSVQDLIEILTKPMSDFGHAAESLADGLKELAKEWNAIVAVEIENQSSEVRQLTSATMHLVREAIANAVHHGMADRVWVKLLDSESTRTIEVLDNGIGPTQNPAGMGTHTYESLSSKWSLNQWDQGGSKLTLELELR